MRGYITTKANVQPNRDGVAAYGMRLNSSGVIPDLTGTGLDAARVGNPRAARGPLGDFFEFPGSGDSLLIGDVPELDFTTDFTFAIWFRVPDGSAINKSLASKYNTNEGWYFIVSNVGRLRAGILGTSSIDTAGAGPVVNDGLWHHAVFVCTNSEITIYSDGEFASETTGTWTPTTTSNTARIGDRNGVSDPVDNMMAPEFHPEAKSATFAAEQYALGKTALFKTNPVNNTIATVVGSAAGPFIGDSPFRALGGQWDINDDTSGDENAKGFDCVVAGDAYMPTSIMGQTPLEAAYGEWEGDFYRAAAVGNTVIGFVSLTPQVFTVGNDGYVLYQQVTSDTLVLGKITNGAVASALDTYASLPLATNYRYKIRRTTAGLIEVWLTGGTLSNELVLTATDNDYSVSNHFALGLRTGDRSNFGSLSGNHSVIKRLLP